MNYPEEVKAAQRVYDDAWTKYINIPRWRRIAKQRAFVAQNLAWADYEDAVRAAR